MITTNWARWTRDCWRSNNRWKLHEGRWFHWPLGILPKLSDHFSFGPQHGPEMLEKRLYIRTPIGHCMCWRSNGHTGVVSASMCSCLFSVILSPHCLQATSAYTPDLEHLVMLYLHFGENERYGCKLRWSAARSRYTVSKKIVATVTSHNGPVVASGRAQSHHTWVIGFYLEILARIH